MTETYYADDTYFATLVFSIPPFNTCVSERILGVAEIPHGTTNAGTVHSLNSLCSLTVILSGSAPIYFWDASAFTSIAISSYVLVLTAIYSALQRLEIHFSTTISFFPNCYSIKQFQPRIRMRTLLCLQRDNWSQNVKWLERFFMHTVGRSLLLSGYFEKRLSRHFLNDTRGLHTFSRNCIKCSENVYIWRSTASTVQLWNVLHDTKGVIFLPKICSAAAFFPIIAKSGRKSSSAYISNSDGSASEKRTMSISWLTNCRCFSSYKHAIILPKLRATYSKTVLPYWEIYSPRKSLIPATTTQVWSSSHLWNCNLMSQRFSPPQNEAGGLLFISSANKQ